MRIAFAGTPEFAARILMALIAAQHTLRLVLTQPDRKKGRGLKLVMSPVKEVAQQHGIAIHQPDSLNSSTAQAPLRDAGVEVMVVAAYGLLLPPAVLSLPKHGCINVHASLLPRWRGAAPIQRAILAGDAQTGVCIMQMDAGLDIGPVLLSRSLPIAPTETGGSLHDKLATLGAELIVEALARLEHDVLPAHPQPSLGATYANKLSKEEAAIDWSQPALQLERQVRAFDPFPVARTQWREEPLKIWAATGVPETTLAKAGSIVAVAANGVTVACGEGVLVLTELQKAGGKRLTASRFLTGHPMRLGDVLG
jgi:methionyl-tRNA formyltransferase